MEETKPEITGRNQDGTFAKGVSGNPAGKPKGVKHMTTKFYEALERTTEDGVRTYSDLLVKRIVEDAIGKGNEAMIKLLVNYIDGMPQQGIDLTSDGDKIETSSVDVMEMARLISKQLKEKKTKNI